MKDILTKKYQHQDAYMTEHLKYNIQFCPACGSYNVVWKKYTEGIADIWRCKNCKKEFELPNKNKLYRRSVGLYSPKVEPKQVSLAEF